MAWKRVAMAVGLALVVLLGWRVGLLLWGSTGAAGPRGARPPVAVETEEVRREPIRETRELTGTVQPLYQYVVAPKVSARLVRLHHRIGDWVRAGEVVAQLDAGEFEQAVLEAEANLKIAQANLVEAQSQFELAAQELERVQSLQAKGISSPAELDAAVTNHRALESRVRLAQAQVEQRQAALNAARIRLGYTVLRATEPGYVGHRFVDEGTLLAANAPVVSVVGIDTVIVRTTVIERVYGRVRVGQEAEVRVDAFADSVFAGRVLRLAPVLDEGARVAQMEVVVANADRVLKPGMFARVQVVLDQRASAQTVGARAVVNRDGAHGVFVVDPAAAVAHYVPVELGIVAGDRAEIVRPAIAGPVVTVGQHLLADGGRVILGGQR